MASRVTKMTRNRNAIRQIFHSPRLVSDIQRRTSAVMNASNSQSSWGGYHSTVHLDSFRPTGRVWSESSASDRGLRMVRNLDAGR